MFKKWDRPFISKTVRFRRTKATILIIYVHPPSKVIFSTSERLTIRSISSVANLFVKISPSFSNFVKNIALSFINKTA